LSIIFDSLIQYTLLGKFLSNYIHFKRSFLPFFAENIHYRHLYTGCNIPTQSNRLSFSLLISDYKQAAGLHDDGKPSCLVILMHLHF